jgi:hypothetical protein
MSSIFGFFVNHALCMHASLLTSCHAYVKYMLVFMHDSPMRPCILRIRSRIQNCFRELIRSRCGLRVEKPAVKNLMNRPFKEGPVNIVYVHINKTPHFLEPIKVNYTLKKPAKRQSFAKTKVLLKIFTGMYVCAHCKPIGWNF